MELAAKIMELLSLVIIVFVVGIVIESTHPLKLTGLDKLVNKFLSDSLAIRPKRTRIILGIGLLLGILSIIFRW